MVIGPPGRRPMSATAAGIPGSVAEQLGHASSELTVRTYRRWLEQRAGSRDRLDAAVPEHSGSNVVAAERLRIRGVGEWLPEVRPNLNEKMASPPDSNGRPLDSSRAPHGQATRTY